MRILTVIFFLCLGISLNAQQVVTQGEVYEVKGKTIFQNGIDITATLVTKERDHIFKTLKNQIKDEKKVEKTRKKLEKASKTAHKSQEKAEKALKTKQKAQEKFNKATKKLDNDQEKYDKLKFKGKLSPNDEAKWLKKLEGSKRNLQKATRKLQSS